MRRLRKRVGRGRELGIYWGRWCAQDGWVGKKEGWGELVCDFGRVGLKQTKNVLRKEAVCTV